MPNNLPIDYVTKDYDGFLQMMKDMIPVLTPEWTDTSDSDQGIVILQLLSYGLHTLGYYQDKAVNENFLHLAQTKKAILLLCKFLGYELQKQQPASTTLRFTKDDTKTDQRVVIPAGTQVSTDPNLGEQIIFETDIALVIDAGTEYGDVTATQGQTISREFIGLGNGQANQTFTLEYPMVLEDTLQIITVENDKDYYWTKVDNMIDSLPTDRHFTTSLNEENQTIVSFGDGIFGMRPLYQTNVFSNYRSGGGTKGNLAVGLINTLVDTFVLGVQQVSNTIAATGGIDYEDLEHARIMAPKIYRTGGKAVTPQDFQDIAESVYGVQKALCEETFDTNNDVNVYIATTDFTTASQTLLDAVKTTLDDVRVMNCKLNVLPCLYRTININITVYVQNNFVASEVSQDVQDNITTYFNSSDFEMGAEIYLAQIIRQAFNASGVNNVVINNPTSDVVCAFNELPKLGTITISTNGGM
jgi:hypothetical protein